MYTSFVLQCTVSGGGNVNTRRILKPEIGSIFHIQNRWNILVIRNFYVNYQNFQNLMLLTYSNTKRKLMHLFLFTNSAQRELVSQYVRRPYTTAISFPCLTFLGHCNCLKTGLVPKTRHELKSDNCYNRDMFENEIKNYQKSRILTLYY